MLDTRPSFTTIDGQGAPGSPISAGKVFDVQIAGRAGIPAGAKVAALNITVVDPEGNGFTSVYPCGQQLPTASNLNYAGGQTVANSVIAQLSAGGEVCIYTNTTANYIIDVSGSFM